MILTQCFIRNVTSCVFCLVSCIFCNAQDASFSQYEANPLYYNPAYTGDATDMRVGLDYRNLWPRVPGASFPGPLSTYDVYGDKQFNNALVGGVGAMLMQNVEGEGLLRMTQAAGLYSWRMPVRRRDFQMSFGAKVSYNQLQIDYSKLTFSDQVDAERGYLNTPSAFSPQGNGIKRYVDIDAGLLMRGNLFKIWSNELSFSAAHLVRPNISLENATDIVPVKYVIEYAGTLPIREGKLYLSPKVMVELQGNFHAYTPGITFYVTKKYFIENSYYFSKPLYVGFFFRSGDINDGRNTKSFIANIGHTGDFGSNTRYQVGFSYDFTIGGLSETTSGAIELTATLIFMTKNRHKHSARCPTFQGAPLGPIN